MSLKEKLSSSTVKRKLWRLLLRSLPFPIPGPELYDLLSEIRKSRNDLDQQISEAMESLQRSSELLTQLEEGLKDRSQRLIEVRKEYERYSELAEIEEKKVEALVQQLEITLGKERNKERLYGIFLNLIVGLIFFIAGAIFSTPLQNWLHKISIAFFRK